MLWTSSLEPLDIKLIYSPPRWNLLGKWQHFKSSATSSSRAGQQASAQSEVQTRKWSVLLPAIQNQWVLSGQRAKWDSNTD